MRTAHGLERGLATDIAQLVHARSATFDAERERIADKLHDIIVHDVTFISIRTPLTLVHEFGNHYWLLLAMRLLTPTRLLIR